MMYERFSMWEVIMRHLMSPLDFSVEGMSGKQLLALAQKDPRTRYAYIIDGGWVHVDVQ